MQGDGSPQAGARGVPHRRELKGFGTGAHRRGKPAFTYGTSIGTVRSCRGGACLAFVPPLPPVPDNRSLKFAPMGVSPQPLFPLPPKAAKGARRVHSKALVCTGSPLTKENSYGNIYVYIHLLASEEDKVYSFFVKHVYIHVKKGRK